jgi:hypothetical protein
MSEPVPSIPEELMLARIAQSEQLREFFVQMWRENPQMAVKAGRKIQEIMSPIAHANDVRNGA